MDMKSRLQELIPYLIISSTLNSRKIVKTNEKSINDEKKEKKIFHQLKKGWGGKRELRRVQFVKCFELQVTL